MNKEFFLACGKRALWTFCESALAMIPVGIGIEEVGWIHVLSVSSLSALIAFLKSIVVGIPEV